MFDFRTIGVIGRRGDPRVATTLLELCQILTELGRQVLIERDAPGLESCPEQCRRVSREQLATQCDLGIVVGGDGTLLSMARSLAPHNVPILGINLGRLGFMVDVPPADMRDALAAVISGRCTHEDRLLLEARIHTSDGHAGPFLAINDVVIRNQAAIRMLEFETWLDREFISLHRADGFIVASPTGSTAYALSSGGPVLHPSLQAITLVPICPHTLSDRPIVVGADQTVRIVLLGDESTAAMCTCDGQSSYSLRSGDVLEVRRASARMRLIHPETYSYFNILRNKLHWGRGPALRPDEL
ncbi:NAD(+) kinase [Sinimarinibacterium sp. CAU 1509]|uniref:NAD(+) kinase n=1 Tax=Sinimarinibacterium sp. CAU 1509 TaxID=2562283 RepID=UPI0010ABE154|nr:NAD(+) kinase [Sinimarinibacterium sp. CAU 1509]TJY55792.1 NAD(+) kinase [Sinimarinibacterium sp. CAU 1509]